MDEKELAGLRNELSVKAKNGVDFIISSSFIWILIAFIWSLSLDSYNKSVLTFMVGALMLPVALLMSKVLKTQWKIAGNPLQPLGLWLNFAQLFYFPFLIFMLIKMPSHFVMTYAIITGAHLFPYAWFYNEKSYAIGAGVISVGSLILGLTLNSSRAFILPLMVAMAMVFLAVVLARSYRNKISM